jgi:hypothetical protein
MRCAACVLVFKKPVRYVQKPPATTPGVGGAPAAANSATADRVSAPASQKRPLMMFAFFFMCFVLSSFFSRFSERKFGEIFRNSKISGQVG